MCFVGAAARRTKKHPRPTATVAAHFSRTTQHHHYMDLMLKICYTITGLIVIIMALAPKPRTHES